MLRLFFNKFREKEQIETLVSIAVSQGIVSASDQAYLEEQAHIKVKRISDVNRIEELKQELPIEKEQRFQLIYTLLSNRMKRGAISLRLENILKNVLRVFGLSRERSNELVEYLKINIRNGLSKEESYKRLGYLVD